MDLVGNSKNLITKSSLKAQICVVREHDERVHVIEPFQGFWFWDASSGSRRPLSPTDTSVRYYLISQKDHVIEPMKYYYSEFSYDYLQPTPDQSDIVKGMTYLINPKTPKTRTGAFVRMDGDKYRISHVGTNETKGYDKDEILRYDKKEVVEDLLSVLKSPRPDDPPSPLLTYEEALEVLSEMGYTSPFTNVGITHSSHFHDYNYRLTHLVCSRNRSIRVLPIHPCPPPKSQRQFHMVSRLPKTIWKDTQDFLKKVDETVKDLKDRGLCQSVEPYSEGTIVLNHTNKMTTFLLKCGSAIPLILAPISQELKDKLESFDIVKIKDDPIRAITNQSVNQASFTPIKDTTRLQRPDKESYLREVKKREKELNDRFAALSKYYLVVREDKDNKLVKEINDIITHPVRLPIQKRQELCKTLSDVVEPKPPLEYLKRFIEYLMINWSSEGGSYTLPSIAPFLTIDDVKAPTQKTMVFTQRQIMNDVHIYFFLTSNPWRRQITLYDTPNDTSLRMRPLEDIGDIVSYETKYPQGRMQSIFGIFRIYTHVLKDEQNDASVISYAMEEEDQYNEQMIQEEFYETRLDSETPIKDLSTYTQKGYCLFTNQYEKNKTTFRLLFDIDKELFVGDNSKIPMICLYQDIDEEGTSCLKNIVFPLTTRSVPRKQVSLQELLRMSGFKTPFRKAFPSVAV